MSGHRPSFQQKAIARASANSELLFRKKLPLGRRVLGATHGPAQRTHFAKFVLCSTINNFINIDAIDNALKDLML